MRSRWLVCIGTALVLLVSGAALADEHGHGHGKGKGKEHGRGDEPIAERPRDRPVASTEIDYGDRTHRSPAADRVDATAWWPGRPTARR